MMTVGSERGQKDIWIISVIMLAEAAQPTAPR